MADVTFTPGPKTAPEPESPQRGPISNNDAVIIAGGGAQGPNPDAQIIAGSTPMQANTDATIAGQTALPAEYRGRAQEMPNPDAELLPGAPPIENSDVQIAGGGRAGPVSNEGAGHLLPGTQTMQADGDRRMGASGHMEKVAGQDSDDVSFSGPRIPDQGSTEVRTGAAGAMEKIAGMDGDVWLTPFGESVVGADSAQDVKLGAEGAPQNNADFNDNRRGARGAPKQLR